MDWKETVMSGKQIYKIYKDTAKFQGCGGVPEYELEMLRQQAEISFNAGQESGCYAEGWANGIKEVGDILTKIGWDRAAHDVVLYLGRE